MKDRDGLQKHLKDCNIGTEIYYPVPLHRQECFFSLGYAEGTCKESESAVLGTLALPIYPELTESQIVAVVKAIKSYYQL